MTPADAKPGTAVRVPEAVHINDHTLYNARGRIVMTCPADDREYWIELDGFPGSRVCFTEHELDQLELR
jgi:hypothetical protein